MTPYVNFWISELQVSDILLPHPSNPKSFCLGPRTYENPTDLISCEANMIPFVSQNIDLNSLADCLRAKPNPPESWITWYSRIAKAHMPLWQELNIADALNLSLSPLDKDENHRLVLVRCFELFPLRSWTYDPYSARCHHDYWPWYRISKSCCSQNGRSPFQTFI